MPDLLRAAGSRAYGFGLHALLMYGLSWGQPHLLEPGFLWGGRWNPAVEKERAGCLCQGL